jgi:23S rRNA (guanosine2251-2'-O)-methyltransferase
MAFSEEAIQFIDQIARRQERPLVLIADRIRSAYNVGSILRTADSAGIAGVVTCDYAPSAKHPKVMKTALGANEMIPSLHAPDLMSIYMLLSEHGYKFYALELSEASQNIWDMDFPKEPTALILGNEVDGIDVKLIHKLNIPEVHLPQYGDKSSNNVANATAIATYEIIRRWR